MRNVFSLLIALSLLTPALHAADAPKPKRQGTKWDAMDVGPFFSSGIQGSNSVLKSVAIKLGDEHQAAISFDTELMRVAFGWTGDFLKLPTGREGLEGVPEVAGTTRFAVSKVAGWSLDGQFADPRPKKYGPLPKDHAHWEGIYLQGDDVVLSYTVGGVSVLEMPGFDEESGLPIFTRMIQIEKTKQPLSLLLAEDKDAVSNIGGNPATIMLAGNAACTAAGIIGEVKDAKIEVVDGKRLVLRLPALKKTTTFMVAIWNGMPKDVNRFSKFVEAKAKFPDLKKLTKGGPKRWGDALVTKGVLGQGDGPYVADTISLPEDNAWKSWLRLSGVDFFKDGRAAVCSVSGDVWIVSGLDSTLNKITWQRFATGLFQPLGLKVVNEQIYVLGRDQITRFHDLNKDGEADYYENFNNDVTITAHYHEFCLDLHTDTAGNFYFSKGGNLGGAEIPHHGTLCRVSADGSKLEVFATGLRAPNGMSVGPNNEVTVSDNEGNWVPTSRINLVKQGGFYGHVFTAHRDPKPTDYDKPLFWLPHSVDNSSGGQAWVTSKQWGPFAGDLLHFSYGKCSLFKVMYETVDGQPQGAVVRFPLNFDSGVMRGRFHPKDGQLYTVGLRVWQSSAAHDGAFHRVRYTGKPVHMPTEWHVKPNGVELTFTSPINEKDAADVQNYSLEQWNYRWTENYGSKEYSVVDPNKIGHDKVEVKSVKVSNGGKTVFLEIPEIKPVMTLKIKYSLTGADGTGMNQEVFATVNRVPGK